MSYFVSKGLGLLLNETAAARGLQEAFVVFFSFSIFRLTFAPTGCIVTKIIGLECQDQEVGKTDTMLDMFHSLLVIFYKFV